MSEGIKKMVRPFARLAFSLLKSVSRPIVFSFKRDLIKELSHDLSLKIDQLSINLSQETQTTSNLILNNFHHIKETLELEIKNSVVSFNEEIQKSSKMMVTQFEAMKTCLEQSTENLRRVVKHEVGNGLASHKQELHELKEFLLYECVTKMTILDQFESIKRLVEQSSEDSYQVIKHEIQNSLTLSRQDLHELKECLFYEWITKLAIPDRFESMQTVLTQSVENSRIAIKQEIQKSLAINIQELQALREFLFDELVTHEEFIKMGHELRARLTSKNMR